MTSYRKAWPKPSVVSKEKASKHLDSRFRGNDVRGRVILLRKTPSSISKLGGQVAKSA